MAAAAADLRKVVRELDELMEVELQRTFKAVAEQFEYFFKLLFNGGTAKLVLTEPEDLTKKQRADLYASLGSATKRLAALQFNPDRGVMGKCDLCADYVDQGRNPSCVDACPMRALDFGEYDELVSKYGDPAHVYPLPQPSITRPSIVVRAHRNARGANPAVSNVEEIGDA